MRFFDGDTRTGGGIYACNTAQMLVFVIRSNRLRAVDNLDAIVACCHRQATKYPKCGMKLKNTARMGIAESGQMR